MLVEGVAGGERVDEPGLVGVVAGEFEGEAFDGAAFGWGFE